MKKLYLLPLLLLIPLAAAQTPNTCNLDATLLNQDPYPAVPGDYVKVVFQVTGVADTSCGEVSASLIEAFPFSLDPDQKKVYTFQSGTFSLSNYPTHVLIPYQIRVADTALDGDNRIELSLIGQSKNLIKNFTINIESLEADFEISIRDYDPSTNTLTFEILNIGENDIEALTVEIPQQSNIKVKGASRNIVGDLDANEDTTFTFEAVPSDGEIEMKILYTDQVNVRREISKSVMFESDYFTERARDQTSTPVWVWVVLVIVILIVIFWIRSRYKRRKREKRH